MRFFLSMYGRDMGEFHVHLLKDGQSENVFLKKGNQGNKWFEGKIPLPANEEYRVRYRLLFFYQF